MPFAYQRDDDRRRITVRVMGSLTAKIACPIVDRVSDEHVSGYVRIYDLTRVTDAPTRDDVQRIADYVQRHASHRPQGPIVIVAPDRGLFGLARLYAAFAGPHVPLHVFRSSADADQWLALVDTVRGHA